MEKNDKIPPKGIRAKISAFEPLTLIIGGAFAVLSAIICMQMIGQVGVSANTSILGAIFAMLLAKIPLGSLGNFKSLERQNYIQTIVSGAGFAAANCAFLAIGILFVMGETSAVIPMAIGCIFGTVSSVFVVGKLYDSKIFPAHEAWPPGVATAEMIEAGDQGGEKARRVLQGITVGIIGSLLKLPVGAIGIVFIASLPSMAALGVGLLIRGYSLPYFNFNIATSYIPQGIMVGAGAIALLQSIRIIMKSTSKSKAEKEQVQAQITVPDSVAQKAIIFSFAIHGVGALLIAAISGIVTDMSVPMLIAWILWTTFSSVVSMVLVGMAAMYSGWFPAFAIATIFMTLGILMGFPPLAMAILTGYISSVGPCFADMGYDLKTGWILRGRGADKAHEVYGRDQQVKIEALGAIIGIVVVIIFSGVMFASDLVPPVSRVFATAISAGANPEIIQALAIWAIPGAIIQFIGGSKMVGVLFATGLLINSPIYGLGVMFAVIIRLIIGDSFMNIRDAGLIAGDGLFGFFRALFKMVF